MKSSKISVFILMLAVLLSAPFSSEANSVPRMMNYQGKLIDSGGQPVNGTVSFTFRIYDDPVTGNTLWAETQTSVTVLNGLFSTLLGLYIPIPAGVLAANAAYLAVRIGSDSEMTPRSRIASVAYAFQAENAISTKITRWISIPGGTFQMGDSFGEGNTDELPVHSVTISAFEMMNYEVTNGTYKNCVTAGSCTPPGDWTSYSGRNPYYGNAAYAKYPVIYVDWNQASAYCAWAGGRLPTEAEWEYAARGGLSSKRFSWGDTIDCSKANYATTDTYAYDVDPYTGTKLCATPGDTTQVDRYAANGYGLWDMTGNVWQWTNDWYSPSYYTSNPATNPQGPASGSNRVVRSGGFRYNASYARVARRVQGLPTFQYSHVGIRCAR